MLRQSLVSAAVLAIVSGGAQAEELHEAGRKVFLEVAQPPCATCHTLADAGATGAIGPVLDELQPDAARVAMAVKNGLGVMPPYEGKLTEKQINAVAAYVAKATGATK